jgi:2-aminoadipate transaminase
MTNCTQNASRCKGSGTVLRFEPSELQRSLDRAGDPSVLSLALGLPATELLPSGELAASAERILSDRRSVQYGTVERRLKSHVVEVMRLRGVAVCEDEIVLTSGAQQALALLGQLLAPEASTILVDEAVYPGFRQAVAARAPQLVSWRESHRKSPAFLYTMSTGHNPLGITMSAQNRAELLAWSQARSTPIVEDDVYGFLQYDGEAAVPLRALDGHNLFYVGSFSKIVAPALRVGWIVAPRNCVSSIEFLKEGSDINTGTLAQRILCDYLTNYSLPSRVDQLRTHYRARRDLMSGALANAMPRGVNWSVPGAGFFFWLEGDSLTDTSQLLEEALIRKVAFVPGSAFVVGPPERGRRTMRLCFSHCSPILIAEAVDRIVSAIHGLQERIERAA